MHIHLTYYTHTHITISHIPHIYIGQAKNFLYSQFQQLRSMN